MKSNFLRFATGVTALAATCLAARAIEVAENLIVDLDMSTVASSIDGQEIELWRNSSRVTGWAGTIFVPITHSGIEYPGPIYSASDAGVPAVYFDGSAATALYNPTVIPATIAGNESWTVEIWVYKPSSKVMADTETMYTWTYRGSGNHTCLEMRYGADLNNAVEHFNDNTPWKNRELPSLDQWHLVTVVHQSDSYETLYVDGETNNTVKVTMDIKENGHIYIGTVRNNNETGGFDDGRSFSGYIAKIRMHAGSLTGAQVRANYEEEKDEFHAPDPETGYRDRVICAGLNQYKMSGRENYELGAWRYFDPQKHTTDHAFVLGAIMAYAMADENNCNMEEHAGYNEYTGMYHHWNKQYTAFAYQGMMWLEKGHTYHFGELIDDFCAMAVNGKHAAQSNGWGDPAYNSFKHTDETGWYPIDIRVADATGGKGRATSNIAPIFAQGTDLGLVYKVDGNAIASNTPLAEVSRVMDPGDGSLFRTAAPTGTRMIRAKAGENAWYITVEMPENVRYGDVTVFLAPEKKIANPYIGYSDGEWSASGTATMHGGETNTFLVGWDKDSTPYCSVFVAGGRDSLGSFTEYGLPELCQTPYIEEPPHVELNGIGQFVFYGSISAGHGDIHACYTNSVLGCVTNLLAAGVSANWDDPAQNIYHDTADGLATNASYRVFTLFTDSLGNEFDRFDAPADHVLYNGLVEARVVSNAAIGTSGIVRFERDASNWATAYPLEVNYIYETDLEPGVDIDASALSGKVTIPAGSAYAEIELPVLEGCRSQGGSVSFRVADGLYLCRRLDAATVHVTGAIAPPEPVLGPGFSFILR